MYGVRHHSRYLFRPLTEWAEAAKFLAVLVVLLAAGVVLSRVLAKRRVLARAGSRAGWVFSAPSWFSLSWSRCSHRPGRVHIPRGAGGAEPREPDVVVILLDALRADHLSAYGYPRETAPSIDGLAHRDGVLFRNARSHGNRTILSVPSIFTSLYPSFHRNHRNRGKKTSAGRRAHHDRGGLSRRGLRHGGTDVERVPQSTSGTVSGRDSIPSNVSTRIVTCSDCTNSSVISA